MPAICTRCQWTAVIPVAGDTFDEAMVTVFRSANARHARESLGCDGPHVVLNELDVAECFEAVP